MQDFYLKLMSTQFRNLRLKNLKPGKSYEKHWILLEIQIDYVEITSRNMSKIMRVEIRKEANIETRYYFITIKGKFSLITRLGY